MIALRELLVAWGSWFTSWQPCTHAF